MVQESDAGVCLLDGVIETDHLGFTGVGYANSVNAIGQGRVWHVHTSQPGAYQLNMRYANGGAEIRPGALNINGKKLYSFEFAPTTAWASWQSATTQVELYYGYNTLSLSAVQVAGLANIDSLTLTGADVRAGNCATARIKTSSDLLSTSDAVEFTAETFTQGGDKIAAFDWNFGDGAVATGKTVSHKYASAGAKTVALTVTDKLGDQSVIQRNIEIKNVASSAKVFIAGDSTVSNYADTASPNDQAGWGQMLSQQYTNQVTIDNRAIGGRTARRFIDEDRLAAIWQDIRAGDYLLVQFGTNDGNRSATYTLNGQAIPYYLAPQTDFKTWLKMYIDGAKSRGVKLVFVTPPPRNSAYCTGSNGTEAHARAMRELAAANDVPLVDLNSKVVTYLKNICPAPVPENFFLRRADGTVDGTHFQERGAKIMSVMVADGMAEANLPINQLRR